MSNTTTPSKATISWLSATRHDIVVATRKNPCHPIGVRGRQKVLSATPGAWFCQRGDHQLPGVVDKVGDGVGDGVGATVVVGAVGVAVGVAVVGAIVGAIVVGDWVGGGVVGDSVVGEAATRQYPWFHISIISIQINWVR